MKKKIAILSTTMVVGGVEKALGAMLRSMDLETYDVTLWLAHPGGEFQCLVPENVTVRYWEEDDPKELFKTSLRKGALWSVAKGVWYRVLSRLWQKDWHRNCAYCVKALPLCDRQKYDYVIAYQGISFPLIATALYRFRGRRKFAWIHSEGFIASIKEPHGFIAKLYRAFDRVICVSAATKKVVDRQLPDVAKKTSVIHNMIDGQEIQNKAKMEAQPLESPSIVTVGRLSGEKGQDMIPAATRILLDRGYPIHWYVIGDGPLRKKVTALCEEHHVCDHVHLLGAKTNPYPYIKNGDIYVQTSLSEGWGLTVQEAKVLQRPIVTTALPVMTEQITHGVNGLIASDVTPEALADEIQKLLEDPALRASFSEALEGYGVSNQESLSKLYEFMEN